MENDSKIISSVEFERYMVRYQNCFDEKRDVLYLHARIILCFDLSSLFALIVCFATFYLLFKNMYLAGASDLWPHIRSFLICIPVVFAFIVSVCANAWHIYETKKIYLLTKHEYVKRIAVLINDHLLLVIFTLSTWSFIASRIF